ncbi:hypothetical protein ABPG72_009181 [Tetrahymena utriculariae]
MGDIDELFAQLGSKPKQPLQKQQKAQKLVEKPQQNVQKNAANKVQQPAKYPSQNQQIDVKKTETIVVEQPTLFKLDKNNIYGKLDAKEYATLQNGSEIIEEIVSDGFKFKNKIDNKAYLIEKFQQQLNMKNKYKKEEFNSDICKKALKQVGYFGIPKTNLKYATFLPMNNMWKTYIRQLISNDLKDENGYAKFLKADLHGSIIQILTSKCQSYEGMQGIVLQEKLKSFRVITQEDKIITVIKQNAVFLFEVYPQRIFKVYGCHLMIRPSDRIKQKFKMRAASQFVLDNS